MNLLSKISELVARLLERRRTRWVEISITRAWSRDLAPRVFDLGDL